jgi:hypothetical protein
MYSLVVGIERGRDDSGVFGGERKRLIRSVRSVKDMDRRNDII